MIRNSRQVIGDLVGYGVEFEQEKMGSFYIQEKVRTLRHVFYSMRM